MRILSLTALAATVLVGALVLGVQAQRADTDWPAHGRDAGAARFSPLKQINTTNVSQLKVAWTYDTKLAVPDVPQRGAGAAAGDAAGARAGGAGAAGAAEDQGGAPPARGRIGGLNRNRQSEATPLVIDGVMYLSTAYNRLVALNPETGKEIWVKDLGHTPATRGISYWPGEAAIPPQIIVGTADGWLLSLDTKTGEFRAGFGDAGQVDMKVLEGTFAGRRVGLSSPPAIYRNLAITGAHSQESPSLGPPAPVRAWDLGTGKLAWTFHTIPQPGEPNHEVWQGEQWVDRAGANSWGLMTVDDARGIVYVPVANPTTDFYGADRLGTELYGSSLVALDAATGKVKWYFQTTHHDNWDYDLTSPPALVDVKQNGQTIPAVAEFTKQGLLFIFDRVTGKPIFGVEERPVVSDNPLPGDVYWPTQPFPVKPPAISRNTFSPSEVAKVTPEHEKFCRGLLELDGGAMTGGPYAQYGPRPRVICPGWTGGGNWNGGAFVPDLGYLVLPTQDHGMLNKMVKSPSIPDMYVRRPPDGAPPSSAWRGKYPNRKDKFRLREPGLRLVGLVRLGGGSRASSA